MQNQTTRDRASDQSQPAPQKRTDKIYPILKEGKSHHRDRKRLGTNSVKN